jgi:secreted trypsin-like serine protease
MISRISSGISICYIFETRHDSCVAVLEMARTFIGIVAFGGLLGCVAPDVDVDVEYNQRSSEMRGGTITTASEFGGVVALLIAPAEICTGTLIHEEWVLTAAHCLKGKQASDVQILFDKTDVKATGGVAVNASQLVTHPQYDATRLGDNDIAVVKLVAPQPNRTRHPVHRDVPSVGSTFVQVGFGAAAAPNIGSGTQRKLVTKSASCSSFGAGNLDATKVLCFGADDGNGTCFGDSGGPSFITVGTVLQVAGVTSFGANDQCTGYDAATMVAAEIAFLDQYVPRFNPVNTTGGTDPIEETLSGGCSTGADRGSVFLALLALLPWRRSRRWLRHT